MATLVRRAPVELMPPQAQTLWGWPAVLNFALGGLGAGFYTAAVLASGFERSPALWLASWLGPLLVLAGFAAVAAEAGRPLRGPRVLARVWTSWMSREMWIGGAFVLLAAADLVFPLRLHRIQAMLAALLLVLAQGFIVRRARGITAWDVPVMPLVFVASALVSGAGLYLLVEVAGGRVPGAGAAGATLALLAVGAAVWVRYLAWSREEPFAGAVRPLARGPVARAVLILGYAAPFVLAALALAAPALAAPALGVGGALMACGQIHSKTLLILAAGQFRPITVPTLRIQRRSP